MKAAKKFKTYYDLIQDKKFIQFLSERITEINESREKALKKGSVLKSKTFDHLKEKKLIDPIKMRDEFIKISEKRSDLPSTEREWIDTHCTIVIGITIRYYDDKDALSKEKRKAKAFKLVAGGSEKGDVVGDANLKMS